jgi:antitoxin (DNA-binding transcriptional repressor) of toxin-antitoxin stability system
MFKQVEGGETIMVMRHGRPIAEVVPVTKLRTARPSWQRPVPRLSIKGADISTAILQERESENIL